MESSSSKERDEALKKVSRIGISLQYFSEELKNDNEIVLAACSQDGRALKYASHDLQNNKEIVLAACSQNGTALLLYAPGKLRKDKEFMLDACSQDGSLLRFASEELKNDKEVVLAACLQHGDALQYASAELKNDKEVVLAALSQYGQALYYASTSLRNDKEVVLAAVESKPESLMYALGGLNQDKDCLIKAGLWDDRYIDMRATRNTKSDNLTDHRPTKIVLSTNFSPTAKSSPHATEFSLRAEAEVEKRRADPKTYTEPIDYSSDPKMKEFLMDFYKNVLFKKQDEMKALLHQHSKTIGRYYKELVPSQMENEDFWQRYYYRVPSVDEHLRAADREITMAAVLLDGLDLKYAPLELLKEKDIVMAACSQNGCALRFASKELKNDKEVVLAACSQWGLALQYASDEMKNDRQVVMKACSKNGSALQYASKELHHNKEVALAACSQDGGALVHVSDELHNDEEIVRAAFSHCDMETLTIACFRQASTFKYALQYASRELRNDKQFMLDACSQDGTLLRFASEELQNDKEVVLAACSQYGAALKYASDELHSDEEIVRAAFSRGDKETVMVACSREVGAFKYASKDLQGDREFVLEVCSNNYYAFKYASEKLKDDKEFVLKVCRINGRALKFASDALRADKNVVMTSVKSKPASLKFALRGLSQDKDCLIKARLWDEDHVHRRRNSILNSAKIDANKKKIVLSTKFSLTAKSSSHATTFTVAFKKHHYIRNGNFVVYSPNAFNKGTCDPDWTNNDWPCRGTYGSCQKPHHLKVGVPQEIECCWRYSFRYQLKAASGSGGFMIQVVDLDKNHRHVLGDGQTIETEMAEDEGIKVFRFFEPRPGESYSQQGKKLISEVQKWYKEGCCDMSECNV